MLERDELAGILGGWFKDQTDCDENNDCCDNVGVILGEILGTENLGRTLGRGPDASSNAHFLRLVVSSWWWCVYGAI
jgi:hypothetical protein